jgi:hypothetical protein
MLKNFASFLFIVLIKLLKFFLYLVGYHNKFFKFKL